MEALKKQVSLPLLLFPFLPFFLHLAQGEDDRPPSDCSPFQYKCGSVALNIRYPFRADVHRHSCFHPAKDFEIACNHTDNSSEIDIQNHKYHVSMIDYENQSLTVVRKDFFGSKSDNNSCRLTSFENTALEYSEFFRYYDEEDFNLTFLHDCSDLGDYQGVKFLPCLSDKTRGRLAFFTIEPDPEIIQEKFGEYCQVVKIPILRKYRDRLEKASPESDAEAAWKEALRNGFQITWSPIDPSNQCRNCVRSNGHCGRDESSPNQQPICYCNGQPQTHTCPPQDSYNATEGGHKKNHTAIIVAFPVVGGVLICATAILCFWYRKRLISSTSSKLLSRAFSSDPPLRSDLEKSDSLYITHVFEYKELEEATNNFDPSKELGDGGFGIVYHGKLRDGRNVAVKRLYENNCRCVEQFKNEIKILSQLRHQNLVTLYGCSSRHSRELLLVYEFIPNGTVADHLHGDRAKPGALIWPTRMSIAIETADALKYLHAVEIIHRDVKTNNILLDNNFHVKVADFGLSRLFPTNVTHISTAPQGTPGYVDPDYRRCYQLTDKSDVYSFGVVLIELISSKPAVDITRHRHDINLANMALNKIHNSALNELVDPSLGFDSNYGVRRMITSVAELAFRCLQDEKESRPSMEEVLEQLIGIESEEYNLEKVEVNTAAGDEALQKKTLPLSPDTVTEAWESKTTTPNASG